ncbi:hypothetical protein [Burkholderia thailandensis]|uniref:Uncharacterized protein n=1 Tax=Burkholderia thailandensis (strain ATCC 700388 / DSM 13276 / CCUG 48851 / CIP 106301 / E264) TaxID=271848 RepID=Q2T674_BURTA|nr:hypothetical protein [Burkholderia thailandensis]ABC34171.1 conserved hypothetical protein [Burkholderia thailandensis E264]AOJ48074.1 hypothetical protein WJ27_23480 [Burkholderia thailandensis]AVR06118.1 hypothetical protein A8H31_00010 [Burkholderia thailandensis]AWY62214.1 hypothetical protein A8H35_30115 [Burkholderia thailandensis]AWY64254.1 hypothetical protein A8H36_02320 [Burkholderia thailandensis]
MLRFAVVDAPQRGLVLEAKTSAYCPRRSAKLSFTRDWLAIRLVSGWVRRRTLHAAEASLREPRR